MGVGKTLLAFREQNNSETRNILASVVTAKASLAESA